MMKGHVKIELFDHKTGKFSMTERDNMLTNALAYRAGIDSNDTIALYSNENSLIPLGTKGLGGLLMFDGPLTEDAGNIHFPMNVHLTGCAGRGSGSPASSLQGTIDSAASGFINGKYTSVWNFLPNQGNGVIAALALTHAKAGATPFHMFRGNAWNTISTGYRHFVAMDPLTDTAYFSYNYQATSVITFYKDSLFEEVKEQFPELFSSNVTYGGAEYAHIEA